DRESFGRVATVDENEEKAGHGRKRRQWIEGHAEGTREFRTLYAQPHHTDLLKEKLQQDARDDQHGDDLLQGKETECRGNETKRNQRTVRDSVPRMNLVQETKKIAVVRRSEGHARVTEQKRKHRSECGP